MKLVLFTTCTLPEFDECGCAVLELTPARLAKIAAHAATARRAAEADRDVWEVSFWGYGPAYYGREFLDACDEAAEAHQGESPWQWQRRLQEEGFLPLPEGVDLERFEAQATEYDQEILCCARSGGVLGLEISWTACPKHSDVEVATQSIPLARLEATCPAQAEIEVACR